MGAYETEGRLAVTAAPIEVTAAAAFGWAVAFGICAVSYYILRGFFHFEQGTLGQVLGWFGGAGKWVQSKIEGAEQKVTHWVGQAAVGSERQMGACFHATADLVTSLGHEIMGQAVFGWHIAQWTSHVAWVALRGHELGQFSAARVAADEKHLAALERASLVHGKAISHADTPPIASGIRQRTKPISTSVGHIGALDLPGIRARNRVRDETVPQSIEGLRERVGEAERGVERLWDKVRHLDKVTTGVLASALVATMLGRLGAGWVRCSNWNRIGRHVCRLPGGLIEALLADALEAIAVIKLCSFVNLLQGVVAEFVPLLYDFVDVENALIGCHGASAPPDLPLRATDLPGTTLGLTLAV